MRIFVFISLIFFFLTPTSCQVVSFPAVESVSDTLRIATFNVRIKTTSDKEEKSWSFRKDHVASLIHQQAWDVFGLQELVNISQETDLRERLPGYEVYSKGRDDNEGISGERLAIFYHKKRFELLESNFFFLSETPDLVSKGWDAALNRICIWVRLRDKVTNREFYFYNAHFDHLGEKARSGSADLIINRVKKGKTELPVFFVGDLNASPQETEVYSQISSYLSDSKSNAVHVLKGTDGTFNGWNTDAYYPESKRIDYVFTRGVQVLTYQVNQKRFTEGGVYPSDHFPVEIECLIKK